MVIITKIDEKNLGQNSEGPFHLFINSFGHLQCIGGRHVLVGSNNAEDNGSFIVDIAKCHSFGDLLDVLGLVGTHERDFGDSW